MNIIKKKIMKKLFLFSLVVFMFSCNNSEKQVASIYNDETVLVVNYKLENMTLDEHAALGAEVAPMFTSESVPGLIGKSFIGDVDRGVFGGVYYFSNSESVSDYLSSDLWKGVKANENLVSFKTEVFNTFKGTELANGSHVDRKTSDNPSDADNLHILLVNYKNKVDPSDEEMSKQIMEYAPAFNNDKFPGMIGKTMINNPEKNIYGGIYYFKSRAAIDNYFTSDLWLGFEGDDNTDVYKKEIYSVASVSAKSNGIPILE